MVNDLDKLFQIVFDIFANQKLKKRDVEYISRNEIHKAILWGRLAADVVKTIEIFTITFLDLASRDFH